MLSCRARGRGAAVHGSLATTGWNGGPLGPAAFGPVAASSAPTDPKVLAILPVLTALESSNVQVTYEVAETATTRRNRRSRSPSTTSYTPFMLMIFGSTSIGLTGSSTMLILIEGQTWCAWLTRDAPTLGRGSFVLSGHLAGPARDGRLVIDGASSWPPTARRGTPPTPPHRGRLRQVPGYDNATATAHGEHVIATTACRV